MDLKAVIRLSGAGKHYPRRITPLRGLVQTLRGASTARGRADDHFVALHPCTLDVGAGEVVGLVGKNGAGKSTLLQLVCGTLKPSEGEVRVEGRVGAILELGAGFNPEFTGLENIHLALATAGATRAEILAQAPQIIAFSGIENFIDQPLRTYSSGMQVRLAFSVATSFNPSIVVIDEALSVGDGEFARRSFDRILALKESGATILFCSHALFHVEALCSRALWLEAGRIVMDGHPSQVLPAYQSFLDGAALEVVLAARGAPPTGLDPQEPQLGPGLGPGPGLEPGLGPLELLQTSSPSTADLRDSTPTAGMARLLDLRFEVEPAPTHRGLALGAALYPHLRAAESAGGPARQSFRPGASILLQSCRNNLRIHTAFASDPALPSPAVAVTVNSVEGRIISSAGSWEDGIVAARDARGRGHLEVCFPRLPLLKGEFSLSVYLFCERGLHVYDRAERVAWLKVRQDGLAQGIFSPARRWTTWALADAGAKAHDPF